jgi:hypothetical protein
VKFWRLAVCQYLPGGLDRKERNSKIAIKRIKPGRQALNASSNKLISIKPHIKSPNFKHLELKEYLLFELSPTHPPKMKRKTGDNQSPSSRLRRRSNIIHCDDGAKVTVSFLTGSPSMFWG